MGDALATATLASLRQEIRRRIGQPAVKIASACDELVDRTLYWWPERRMAEFASRQKSSGPEALDAIGVISAKVREDVEHRWGLVPNVTNALDLLAMNVVVELSAIWFSSPEARIDMRRIIFQLRQPKPE